MKNSPIDVAIIMGSDSDLPVMQEAADFLDTMGISYELTIVSAHRTPKRLVEYSEAAEKRGFKVIIAGAGGAAHLPGMVASMTTVPVIGVPVKARISIDGWDSILSILQMPPGIPVGTMALNGSRNAGIFAAQILSVFKPEIRTKLQEFKASLESAVMAKVEKVQVQKNLN
jgi:5-(carboxyamino)imidazole ribonucleotide mutase